MNSDVHRNEHDVTRLMDAASGTHGHQPHTPPSAKAVWLSRLMSLLVLAAFSAAFFLLLSEKPKEDAPTPRLGYTTADRSITIPPKSSTWKYIEMAKAEMRPRLAPNPVPGRVAVDEALASRVMAPLVGRVEHVNVIVGQRVKEGDRLQSVRSGALVDLERQVKVAETDVNAARRSRDRVRALVELKAAPEKDLLAADHELRDAELQLQGAVAMHRSLKVSTESDGLFWLVAPRGGVVFERNVAVGQEVGPDRADPLVLIAEVDEVLVFGSVPETDVLGIQVDQDTVITSPGLPGERIPGRVEYISEVIDPVRRTFDVRMRIANPQGMLRLNAFVTVTFVPGADKCIVVSSDAVAAQNDKHVLFVQGQKPGELLRRDVEIGRQREGKIEIIKGLNPGEEYVAKGTLLLLDATSLTSE